MKKLLLVLFFSFTSLFAFEHLTPENIDAKLKDKKAVVDFYATWCPPCKVLAKNLIEFDKVKPKDVVIYKVDIDEHMDLAKKYNVRSLPTLVYIKDGEVTAREVGVKDVESLSRNMRRYF